MALNTNLSNTEKKFLNIPGMQEKFNNMSNALNNYFTNAMANRPEYVLAANKDRAEAMRNNQKNTLKI